MNRRRFLARTGVLAGSMLAGCLGSEESSESGTPERTGTTETATTATPTTTTATTTTTTASSTATPTSEPTTARSTTDGGIDTRTTKAASASPAESPGSAKSTRTTRSPSRSSVDTGGAPTIADRRLTVSDRSCGAPVDEGTITIENGRVVASGTITGSDACATAVLDEARYDREANRLRIVVATKAERETGAVCAQCLTEIDYEATVGFDGGVPMTVVLVHRGATGETRVGTMRARPSRKRRTISKG